MSAGLNAAKGRQRSKRKTYYANQSVTTERNKKRNLRKRIRDNPRDSAAVKRYEQNFGRADGLGLSARGKRLEKRYARQAAP